MDLDAPALETPNRLKLKQLAAVQDLCRNVFALISGLRITRHSVILKCCETPCSDY